MHAAGGNVLFYRDLAAHLGSDQPVYGLQAREDPATGRFPNRVKDMAAAYISELLRFRPDGPFHLCGSSFGGIVAYEMAQQLFALGREIALLALFDTYGPGYPKTIKNGVRFEPHLFNLSIRLQNFRGQLAQMNHRAKLEFALSRLRRMGNRIRRRWIWKRNEFQRKYHQAMGAELPKDLQRNHKAIQEALKDYAPGPYPGRLTLFRANIQPKGIQPDPNLGWAGLPALGIDLHEAPGIHGAMTVDPYAKALAEHLQPLLSNCTASAIARTVTA